MCTPSAAFPPPPHHIHAQLPVPPPGKEFDPQHASTVGTGIQDVEFCQRDLSLSETGTPLQAYAAEAADYYLLLTPYYLLLTTYYLLTTDY